MTARRMAAAATVLFSVLGWPAQAAARRDAAPLTLVAGGNGSGFTGDGGPAASARIDGPHGAAVGPDGTLYIADTGNHRVRAVASNGTISTVAGDGRDVGESGRIPAGTEGTAVSLRLPTEVAVGGDGTVYIADSGVGVVYALAVDGSIGIRGDVSGSRQRRDLRGLAVAADGTVYVSDRGSARVLAFSPDGSRSVAAGNGAGSSRTPVTAPGNLAVDSHGDLWIAAHHLFRAHAGAVAPIILPPDGEWAVGDAGKWPPGEDALVNVAAVGVGSAGVFVMSNTARNVRRLNPDGSLTNVVELPVDPFGTSDPVELAVGPATGSPLYLIDTAGSRIFAIDVPAGVVVTPDEGPATWVWPVGALAGVVLLVVVIGLLRRRRRA